MFLNLGFLGAERLLIEFFDEVGAPPEVRLEFERLSAVDPRFQGLCFPDFVVISSPKQPVSLLQAGTRLHSGEAAAICLATERSVDAVLLDDRAARKAAVELGLTVIGVVGILLEAKLCGRIEALRQPLDLLESEAKFRIAPVLRKRVLALAGEPEDSGPL